MEDSIRIKIDKLADEINKIVFPDKQGGNLEKALENQGIDIRYFADNSGLSGFLVWDATQSMPVISINALDSETRQRFSMAHELGHLIIGFRWLPVPYSDNNNLFDENKVLNVTRYRGATDLTALETLEETKVNEFAAAFLLPDSQLKRAINKNTKITNELVQKLANKYGVSEQATRIRVGNYLRLNRLNDE